MKVDLITKDDLTNFKLELLKDLYELIKPEVKQGTKWLKSADVKKILKVSSGTLQHMRNNGTIPSRKLGNIFYYTYEDLSRLLPIDTSNP